MAAKKTSENGDGSVSAGVQANGYIEDLLSKTAESNTVDEDELSEPQDAGEPRGDEDGEGDEPKGVGSAEGEDEDPSAADGDEGEDEDEDEGGEDDGEEDGDEENETEKALGFEKLKKANKKNLRRVDKLSARIKELEEELEEAKSAKNAIPFANSRNYSPELAKISTFDELDKFENATDDFLDFYEDNLHSDEDEFEYRGNTLTREQMRAYAKIFREDKRNIEHKRKDIENAEKAKLAAKRADSDIRKKFWWAQDRSTAQFRNMENFINSDAGISAAVARAPNLKYLIACGIEYLSSSHGTAARNPTPGKRQAPRMNMGSAPEGKGSGGRLNLEGKSQREIDAFAASLL